MKRALLGVAVASLLAAGCGREADETAGSNLQSQSQELKTLSDGTVDCTGNKTLVCHKDPDGAQNVLCIATSSSQTHLDHGDYLGDCTVDAGTL